MYKKPEVENHAKTKIPPIGEFLSLIFGHVSHCNFDKAKDVCKKEKELTNSNIFKESMLLIPGIIDAERCYMELGYFNDRRNPLLWKENNSLRYRYESMRQDFSYIQEGNVSNELLMRVLYEIVTYISIRIELVNLYDAMYCASSCSKHIKFPDLVSRIHVTQLLSDTFKPQFLTAIKTSLRLEVECLSCLLNAQFNLQNWQLLPCAVNLHTGSKKLTSWLKALQPKETWRIGFLKNNSLPELYHWMVKFKLFIAEKFSVYFYKMICQEISDNDFKSICIKHHLEYLQRFQNLFQRSGQESSIIMLVFDACGLKNWYGPGYHYPTENINTANNSHYIMLSNPEKVSRPLTHLPIIKKIILDHFAKLLFLDRVVSTYVVKEDCTYFITSIEDRVSLVVFYNGRKEDKEGEILNFMSELAATLRCHRLFSTLKPDPK